jgi:transcriptional regulator with XRE-family HTH domain
MAAEIFPVKSRRSPLLPVAAANRPSATGTAVDPGRVLAKATARASTLLGLSGAALARVIGVSEPTVSRILRGERPLPPGSKEGELAALLVRVYRSLDALVGNDDGRREAWMSSRNDALGGVPRELVQTAEGLVATLVYLDGLRAPA